MSDFEHLLRNALVPVEPPVSLTDRLERRLTEQLDHAAGELGDWELGAMRDPRNWLRPIVAGGAVVAAGGALVVVRARQQQKRRSAAGVRAIESSAREVASEVRRRIGR